VRAPKNFLFPVRALSPVFRAKLIDALERAAAGGKLSFSGQPALAGKDGWCRLRESLHRHAWAVYAKQPFAEPQHLIRYLGRYVNRIAIANHRLQSIDGDAVAFSYKDNRIKDRQVEKTMHLQTSPKGPTGIALTI